MDGNAAGVSGVNATEDSEEVGWNCSVHPSVFFLLGTTFHHLLKVAPCGFGFLRNLGTDDVRHWNAMCGHNDGPLGGSDVGYDQAGGSGQWYRSLAVASGQNSCSSLYQ